MAAIPPPPLLNVCSGYSESITIQSSYIFPLCVQLLHDVVYSLCDRLIFVLLKTNDVLVFSANTNPCSAKELWVPNKRNKINCIAMVSTCFYRHTLKNNFVLIQHEWLSGGHDQVSRLKGYPHFRGGCVP